jgi:hypothetical protein
VRPGATSRPDTTSGRPFYGLFRRWQRDGTWNRILTHLQAEAHAKGLITCDVRRDSTIVRAHQHAAGARKKRDLQHPGHRWPAARRCRVPASPGAHPGTPRMRRQAAPPTGPGAGGQGLWLPSHPRLPAPTWDPLHDPGEVRPDPQSQKAGRPRQASAEARQGRLPRTPRGRVRDQPPQAPSSGVNEIRQDVGVPPRAVVWPSIRQANSALHTIAIARLCWDTRTRSSMERRGTEGKTPREAIRCLKRYVARETYQALLTPRRQSPAPAPAGRHP